MEHIQTQIALYNDENVSAIYEFQSIISQN